MPNPFGITEVSLPAIYGAVNENRLSRLQQMMAQRQLEGLERQADREIQQDSLIARVTGQGQQGKPMGGAYSGASQAAATQAPAGPQAPGMTQPAPVAPAGSARLSPEDEMALRLSGPRGTEVADVYRGMSDRDRAITERRAATGLRAAQYLITLPQERVMAEFEALAPDLISSGFSREELTALAQNGLTREELQGLIQRGLMYVPPSYRNVEGEVLDERLLGTRLNPRVYASEYISTPQGLAARPGGGSRQPPPVLTDEDISNLDRQPAPGATQTGAWPTPYADPNQPNPGGAARAGQQTFR
jgi:hypothetical protein